MNADDCQYTRCEEAEDIGLLLINSVHDRLNGLRIGYYLYSGSMTRGGKTILGKAKKVDRVAHEIYGSDLDFIIVLNGTMWPMQSDEVKTAIVDHELSHLAFDAEAGCSIIGHDLQEFAGVVERHGLWESGVKQMARAIQPHLEGLTDELDFSIDKLRDAEENGEEGA